MSYWTEEAPKRACDYCGEAGPHVDEALFLSNPMFSHGEVVRGMGQRGKQTLKPVVCPSCTRAILDLRHECRNIECQQA